MQAKMICPKCTRDKVKHFESWSITFDRKVPEPPTPMWTCLNPTSLHKWRREESELIHQMKQR